MYVMISDNFVPNLISDAEVKLREAYRIAEANHRRSQQLQHQSNLLESQHRRDTNVMIYIRRRLAMCARKLGKLKEASVPNFFFPKILAQICRYLPYTYLYDGISSVMEFLLWWAESIDIERGI